jgi:hypothetical protein
MRKKRPSGKRSITPLHHGLELTSTEVPGAGFLLEVRVPADAPQEYVDAAVAAMRAVPTGLDRAKTKRDEICARLMEHADAGLISGAAIDDLTRLLVLIGEIDKASDEQEESLSKMRDYERFREKSEAGSKRILRNAPAAAKAAAKQGAKALWDERHAGKHPKLRTVEQFATEVMRRWPVLTSSKVICQWSADWTREAREA